MKIRCPNCHHPIDLTADCDLSNLVCPQCQSGFNLIDPQAATVRLPEGRNSLGHFDLLDLLGSGGFGSVWKARDRELDRLVAIKIPRRDGLSRTEAEVFFREARAAAQLRHPSIVSVHEVGRDDKIVYIVSDYIDGVSLKQWLKGQRLSLREAAELTATIAEALHHAHEQGVVHRDLKPSNILMDARGRPHVVDFGLAKRASGELTMTIDGRILGTPAYMSPEQAQGKGHEADRRSDVYSLGTVLFELASGELPFRGDKQMLIYQVLHEEAPSPRTLNARIPRDLETITLKCLEKAPERRYATAAALAADLRRYLAGEMIEARPLGRVGRAWRWSRRNPALVAAAAVIATLLVTVAVGAILSTVRIADEQRRAEEALAQTQQALSEAERSQDQAEQNQFVALNRLLDRELSAGNVAAARGVLASIPARLRDWEWSFAARELSSEVLTLRGHKERVWSVAFSPDGKWIASGGADERVTVWATETGREVWTLARHASDVRGVAFSPDGRWLVSASFDNSLKLWDPARGELVRSLAGHGDRVVGVAFHPEGQLIASAGHDGTVRMWDQATGQKALDLAATAAPPTGVCFNLDGSRLAAGDEHGTVYLWDTNSGSIVQRLAGHEGSVNCVAFAADGKTLASAGADRTVRLWDANQGQPIDVLVGHASAVTCLAFDPAGGRRLVSGSEDQSIRMWDVGGGRLERILAGQGCAIASIAWSADQRWIVSGGTDGGLKLWSAIRRLEHAVLAGPAAVTSMATSADGRWAATACEDGTVRLWDTRRGEPTLVVVRRDVEGRLPLSGVALSADGQLLAAAGADNLVRLYGARTGQTLGTLAGHHGKVSCVMLSADGRRVITGAQDRTVRIWDAQTFELLLTLSGHKQAVTCVALSPDQQVIASTSADGTLRLWDATTGAIQRTISLGREVARALAFDITGDRLAVAGDANGAQLLEVATGQVLLTLSGHRGPVRAVAFGARGQRVATGGDDRAIRIWDATSGAELRTMPEHSGSVVALAFADDGSTLLSAADREVHVRDARSTSDLEKLARVLVLELARTHATPGRLQKIMESQPGWTSELQQAATAQAASIGREPDDVYCAARDVCLDSERPRADYERALLAARELCELEPRASKYRALAACASYRLGDLTAARAVLNYRSHEADPVGLWLRCELALLEGTPDEVDLLTDCVRRGPAVLDVERAFVGAWIRTQIEQAPRLALEGAWSRAAFSYDLAARGEPLPHDRIRQLALAGMCAWAGGNQAQYRAVRDTALRATAVHDRGALRWIALVMSLDAATDSEKDALAELGRRLGAPRSSDPNETFPDACLRAAILARAGRDDEVAAGLVPLAEQFATWRGAEKSRAERTDELPALAAALASLREFESQHPQARALALELLGALHEIVEQHPAGADDAASDDAQAAESIPWGVAFAAHVVAREQARPPSQVRAAVETDR